MGIKTQVRALVLATALVVGGVGAAVAGEEYLGANGLAVSGYDPVAYFTQGQPVEGDAAFSATHNGATFHFSSAENLSLFQADPAKYAPAFDGHCAYGAAVNAKVPGDPQHWKIVDGVLYLNVSSQAQKLFDEDVAGNLQSAEANWVSLEPKPAADPK